jgi:2-polyprenyl-3-methyl-5-hydroxy-6-metoxy-1,4-benzoquinol methylase
MKLPLEYNKLSEYFDVLSSDNSNVMNRSIEKVLKKHKVKTVLDLTCGTGSQVFWLAKRGYQVVGSDLSPKLIKIAKGKAYQEKIKVKLLKGDMRTKQVGRFDAVITIHNAVGHLTKTDFEKAMRNVCSNLKKGGLYVFDIFNLNSMSDKVVENLKMDVKETVGTTKIHHIQYSKISKKTGRLTSYDHFSFQENSGKPKILKGKFALQIYTAQELREMLVRNGFAVLGQYGIDGSKFSEKKAKEILTVAAKR